MEPPGRCALLRRLRKPGAADKGHSFEAGRSGKPVLRRAVMRSPTGRIGSFFCITTSQAAGPGRMHAAGIFLSPSLACSTTLAGRLPAVWVQRQQLIQEGLLLSKHMVSCAAIDCT